MDIFGGKLNKYAGESAMESSPRNVVPRSLRQQLQDQLLYHQGKCKRIEEAIEALTPDVEKVLDALQKLQY